MVREMSSVRQRSTATIPESTPQTGFDSDELVVKLAETLATVTGSDPVRLDPPINDVVDLDALERLFASLDDAGRVEFEYEGYSIEITGDGTIAVDGIVYRS